MSLKQILSELEDTAQDFEYLFQASDFIVNKLKEAGEQNATSVTDPTERQKLAWEHDLFKFATNTEYGNPRKGRRFYPMMTGTTEDGAPFEFPNILSFTPEAVSYLKQRASETKNKVMLARYSDFIWEQTKEPQFGVTAYEAYFNQVDDFFSKEWEHRALDAIDRCVFFAMVGVVSNEKVPELKRKIWYHIDRLLAEQNPRFLLELFDILLEFKPQYLNPEDFTKLRAASRAALDFYEEKKNYLLLRSFLQRAAEIDKREGTGKPPNEWKEAIAITYEQEAQERETKGEFLAASFFFNDALKLYQESGNSAKIEFLKKKIVEMNQKAVPQFTGISTEINIPEEMIQKVVNPVLKETPLESLKSFAKYGSLIPRYQSAVEATQSQSQESPLMFLARASSMDDRGYTVAVDEDPFRRQVIRNLMLTIDLTSLVFTQRIIEELKKQGLTADTVVSLLKEWEFADEEHLQIIQRGVERYLEGDYISSIHILIPQIEGLIIKVLHAANVPLLRIDSRELRIRNATLNDLFGRQEVVEIFGEDLWHYYDLVLLNPKGWNLRNAVAHGYITPTKLTAKEANIVFHLLLLLTNIQRKELAVTSPEVLTQR